MKQHHQQPSKKQSQVVTDIFVKLADSDENDDTDDVDVQKLSVLTVGDGDFSGSLAILLAYGHHLDRLVATTLLSSREDLLETYPHAESILETLQQNNPPHLQPPVVVILYGVDATQLHVHNEIQALGPFDFILFHHPHCGYNSQQDNDDLASTRHGRLLAHYLFSAQHILRPEKQTLPQQVRHGYPPCIHVCLCAGQSKSWKLKSILRRLQTLEVLGKPQFISQPLWPHLQPNPAPIMTTIITSDSQNQDHDMDKGKTRQHWLSQYGYQHQATHPGSTQLSNVVNSHHYFFRMKKLNRMDTEQLLLLRVSFFPQNDCSSNSHKPWSGRGCPICGKTLLVHEQHHTNVPDPTALELEAAALAAHLAAPVALPVTSLAAKFVHLGRRRSDATISNTTATDHSTKEGGQEEIQKV